jgi:hypothetical protein
MVAAGSVPVTQMAPHADTASNLAQMPKTWSKS